MVLYFEYNNIYSNILVTVLKYLVFVGFDFGFFKHKSIVTKCLVVLPCLIQCVTFAIFSTNIRIGIEVIQIIYVVAYICYVLVITRNNVLNPNMTLNFLRRELQYIDLKLKCSSAAEYVDKRLLIVFSLIFCQRLSRICIFCFMTGRICGNSSVSMTLIFFIFFYVEIITAINAYVFYAIYHRLVVLTSIVNICDGSLYQLIRLYVFISNIAGKYTSTFNAVVSWNTVFFISWSGSNGYSGV